jgi:hypothetical protein
MSLRSCLVWGLALIMLVNASCARRAVEDDEGDDGATSCQSLKGEQAGTFLGRWNVPPVPVAFFRIQEGSEDFTSDEKAAIARAADSWNRYFANTLGFPVIQYGSVNGMYTSSSDFNPFDICSQSAVSGDSFEKNIVLYKLPIWPAQFDSSEVAITTTCRQADSYLPRFYSAKIEINGQNFFNSGQQIPDLESLLLHEFGHLIGLDHSCSFDSKEATPLCETTTNQEFIDAVMNPSFRAFSTTPQFFSRELKRNDTVRAACLYFDRAGS